MTTSVSLVKASANTLASWLAQALVVRSGTWLSADWSVMGGSILLLDM
jgi:hypothetical protein